LILIGFDALKKAKASPGRPQGVEASVVLAVLYALQIPPNKKALSLSQIGSLQLMNHLRMTLP
jgi:hypothetical protein